MQREAKEECGLDIEDIKPIGLIEFQFEGKMNETLECHVFCADKWRGELRECDGKIFFFKNSFSIIVLFYKYLISNLMFKNKQK